MVSRIALARAVAAAALGVDGVVDLDGGPRNEVATYAAGQRVRGVRVLDPAWGHLQVRIVAGYGRDLVGLCEQVRAAVSNVEGLHTADGRPPRIDVRVVAVAAAGGPAG